MFLLSLLAKEPSGSSDLLPEDDIEFVGAWCAPVVSFADPDWASNVGSPHRDYPSSDESVTVSVTSDHVGAWCTPVDVTDVTFVATPVERETLYDDVADVAPPFFVANARSKSAVSSATRTGVTSGMNTWSLSKLLQSGRQARIFSASGHWRFCAQPNHQVRRQMFFHSPTKLKLPLLSMVDCCFMMWNLLRMSSLLKMRTLCRNSFDPSKTNGCTS